MATVYLPLGYPLVQGEEFDTVVFQGMMVRKYTIPKDPRTDSQIFNRRIFSDVAKMRASMGEVARGFMRLAFGSNASSIIGSMARADVDGLWSARITEWEGFDNDTKAYLSGEAPFQGTLNDPGKVYWALYGMIYDWFNAHSFQWAYMPEPDHTYLDDMFEWWRCVIGNAGRYGVLYWGDNYEQSSMIKTGTWSTITDAGASGGSYIKTQTVGSYVEFCYYGRICQIWYTGLTSNWQLYAWQDFSTIWETINQLTGSTLYQQKYTLETKSLGIHHVKLQLWNGGNPTLTATVDATKIARLASEI